ncbi:methyltransferase, FkbM family [Mariprofundus ferrinatatus]|uniref:Methyltransferase, FkbM family n=1 Tax=Mariprofundus ferrinatatus TaxID=1921087 RepID=A0A2K8L6R3_9PROT|nr:FkbM family methyltransferase [Mariprofundus ferrinatatus]ATX82967.1 methyltransferase, FkbM family [Mariprofundus ferrinatatus]
MDFANCYLQLRRAGSPEELWQVCDSMAMQHPLFVKNDPDSLLVHSENIVLYGAGRFALSVINAWKARYGIAPAYCVDSNEEKWGGEIAGIPVCSPDSLFSDQHAPLVVIAAMITSGIQDMLDAQGFSYLFAEQDGSVGYFSGHWLYRNRGKFSELFHLLADSASRKILMDVAKARMFQQFHFSMPGNVLLANSACYPQYFQKDIFSFSEGELLIDCGSFDGDTLLSYFSFMQDSGIGAFSAIGFDVDKVNIAGAIQSLNKYGFEDVEVIHSAVGNTVGRSKGSDFHNCRDQAVEGDVPSISLDDFLVNSCPTMIKMDIEGAELDALDGAREVIKRCKPKLAVCIYHQTSHLLDIPLFIHDHFSFYDLFIRHHAAGSLWETVCYAVPASMKTKEINYG